MAEIVRRRWQRPAQATPPAVDEDTDPDPYAEARNGLLQAIANRNSDQRQLALLQTARERAREQSWAISARQTEAATVLRQAQHDEPTRLAYQYANAAQADTTSVTTHTNGHAAATLTPVEAAQAALAAVQEEDTQNTRLENALDREIDLLRSRLNQCQDDLRRAVANLVVGSNEYDALIKAHTAAWQRLRTIKTTLRTISAATGGHLPQKYLDIATLVEPFEERVGYGIDRALVDAWKGALEALQNDPDAALPSV